jgi:hypothetical protein
MFRAADADHSDGHRGVRKWGRGDSASLCNDHSCNFTPGLTAQATQAG